jgi:hypothetical protein
MEIIIATVRGSLNELLGVELFRKRNGAESVLNYFEAAYTVMGRTIVHRNATSLLTDSGVHVSLSMGVVIDVENIEEFDIHDTETIK